MISAALSPKGRKVTDMLPAIWCCRNLATLPKPRAGLAWFCTKLYLQLKQVANESLSFTLGNSFPGGFLVAVGYEQWSALTVVICWSI